MFKLISWCIIVLLYNLAYLDNLSEAYRAGRKEKLDQKFKIKSYLLLQILIHLTAFGSMIWRSKWPLIFFDEGHWPGLILSGMGLVLIFNSKRCLATNYSPCQDSYLPATITVRGPYRYIRHPLYTANLAYFAGLTLGSGSLLTLLLLIPLITFFVRSARVEEDVLSRRFADYSKYKQKTKRFLPWIY